MEDPVESSNQQELPKGRRLPGGKVVDMGGGTTTFHDSRTTSQVFSIQYVFMITHGIGVTADLDTG